ncbi:MAG: helix-turn-helix domain-containing protein, partial [Alphaproteobacteria bacterium]
MLAAERCLQRTRHLGSLKLLEENVGMPLFDRSSRGLRPTDAGSYML